MKNSKTRIKYITVFASIVAILSLGIGYSSSNEERKISGTAEVVENIYEIILSNIHEVKTTNESVSFKQQPVINGKEIYFSISSLSPGSNASFKFDIENLGNINSKIKEIKLSGLENYEKNVSYKISNLKEKDRIKKESKIADNEFILSYDQALLDDSGNPINLDLDNLVLTIELEQVKE